jgi:AAA+ superfamily predicted ATPase
MVNKALTLQTYEHPKPDFKKEYDNLIGLDSKKAKLLSTLKLLLVPESKDNWIQKHHSSGLNLLNLVFSGTPLIILEGDVGCGKTALAQSVATPLAMDLEKKIVVFETPSNIRGSGLVGEISNRITEAFEQVKRKLTSDGIGLLIIDEADDIATSREQNQAHHEDRAGLNVLIKQIDQINKQGSPFAVLLITNRVSSLDPAVRRRAALELKFERPKGEDLKSLLVHLLDGIDYPEDDLNEIVSELDQKEVLYSYSDLIHRVMKEVVYSAIEKDEPLTFNSFKKVLETVEPSPTFIS